MAEVLTLSGIDRFCFSPYVAGTAAWIISSGGDPTPSEVDRICSSHFVDKTGSGYTIRFESYYPSSPTRKLPAKAERDELLEEAFLTSKAALRRIVYATTVGGVFRDDQDYEQNSVFQGGQQLLNAVELPLTALDEFEIARCPQCGLVGQTDGWFGRRTIGGRTIPQSWCRICRGQQK